ncbi:MAG: hybrid sensor histidine kinase/response regulator [Spirosoma sp.]|nr:hybrid sensor histidine kinase/response regulator [Spirosoma sp.]
MDDMELLSRRLSREKNARKRAEVILEKKAKELVKVNEQLKHLNEHLEQQIQDKLTELQQSEQRYRQLIESVQDIIFKTSPDGHFSYVSPAVVQLIGYTEQEIVGMHFLQIIQPGHRQRLLDFYQTMVEKGQHSTYTEFPVVAKDGHIVWIGQTARLIQSEDEAIELVAVARDVSASKIAEKVLETTQLRLTTLITNLPSGVMVENQHRHVILVNQLFCNLFDLPVSPDELVGFDCSTAAWSVKQLMEKPDEFVTRIDELLANREAFIGEVIHMANGHILERDYIPIFLDEQYMGHLWRYTDVTANFRDREQIRRSEEKYRGIMNNMELGLLEVDNDQKILRAYERCCNMLGYTEEELIGQNAADLLVPPEFRFVNRQQEQQRKLGNASSYELQLIRKDGSRIWVLVSGVPIFDEHGVLVGSIGIHYDLSQQKVLEQELAKAKEIAEDSSQAEKQFLANMSHEIRTPLNAIIGMSHLLFDTQPTQQQREYIDILKTSADFLHSLISDLLDMTKIEAGRIEVHARPFDLVGLLRATQKVFEMKLEGRPVEIDVMLDARITGDYIGDDLMLNQILMNLVGNAEKFTEKGLIQITAKLKQDGETDCWIEFTVADTGIGIPDEKLHLVFQKFKQVNPQGHKHKGTGLGLAITKELVDIQGGKIKVESRIGQGSVFTFTLPFAKSKTNPESTGVAKAHQDVDHAVMMRHILVVEDNVMNLKYIGELLKKWNIPYTVATDGKMAVEEAKKQLFDLILMDIQMPLMDGYEATVAIRNTHNPNQQVPIIALTASAMLDHKYIAIEAGMNGFLTKPFDPGQLMAILKRYAPVITETDKSLDYDRLNELYGLDTAYSLEMFDMFLTDIVPEFAQLPLLCQQANWPALAQLTHKLKPTLGMVGLSWLEEKMDTMEKKSLNNPDKDIIEKYCNDIVTGINKMLPILQKEIHKLSYY